MPWGRYGPFLINERPPAAGVRFGTIQKPWVPVPVDEEEC
jgi:hypothetical protein